MENKPIEIIEFDVVLANTVDKIIKAKKIRLELFNKYLTYITDYVIEQEFVLENDRPDDPILRNAFDDDNTDKKLLKVEDCGIIGLKDITLSTEVQNILGSKGEKTSLVYSVMVESRNNTLCFNFINRKGQIDIYNKLVTWQITQNNWN